MNSLIRFSSISCRPLAFSRGLALGQDVGLEVGEAGLARLDPPAELAVPAPVALLDEGGEAAVGR